MRKCFLLSVVATLFLFGCGENGSSVHETVVAVSSDSESSSSEVDVVESSSGKVAECSSSVRGMESSSSEGRSSSSSDAVLSSDSEAGSSEAGASSSSEDYSSSEEASSSSEEEHSSSSANAISSSSSSNAASSSSSSNAASSSSDLNASSSSNANVSSSSIEIVESSGTAVSSSESTDLLSHSYTKEEIFASRATYGEMTDERDGQTYKTVVIGSQEWMAQNLNYKTDDGSYCFDDNAANCEVYGRLYTAKAMISQLDDSYRDVCPIGWHVPSSSEWQTLISYVSANTSTPVGTALKSPVGFECHESKCDPAAPEGTNEFGFSAIGSGLVLVSLHASEGVAANYWMSDYYEEKYPGTSFYAKLQRFMQLLFRTETLDQYTLQKGLSASVSVRCVKD